MQHGEPREAHGKRAPEHVDNRTVPHSFLLQTLDKIMHPIVVRVGRYNMHVILKRVTWYQYVFNKLLIVS